MLKSKMILTVVVCLGLLAGTGYAIVTPGAVLEFNAANNPGEAGGQFTNQGSNPTAALPAFNAYAAYSGLPPVAVADGPGPLLNRSYDNVDVNGDPTCWAGPLSDLALSQISFEWWIKPRAWAGGEGYLGALMNEGWAQYVDWPTVHAGAPDTISPQPGGGGGGAYATDLVGPVPVDVWTHVVVTFDDGTDLLNAYMGGVPVATDQPLGADVTFGSVFNWLGIGASAYGPASAQAAGARFDGQIALLRIYDAVLTEGEVIDNMNSVIPEPATLCLLGLGGLALLRRRR